MAETRSSFVIQPGRGLGWITLGASLHAVLTRLKSQPLLYPHINLAYSNSDPTLDPVVLDLAANGLRLRFDGPDQRLRLIEILDFSKATFLYKATELVRRPAGQSENSGDSIAGPSFKHLYNRLFGPTYAGEYIAPDIADSRGIYVLSWPGLAARFSLKSTAWSEKADFVSLLSSSAASNAMSLAIFSGLSWPEARATLYNKRPQLPRSLALSCKMSEALPDEVEEVVIHGSGRLELFRRTSPPFMIILNETSPQDLVAELGPPDAIFRKSGTGLSIHAGGAPSKARQPSMSPSLEPHMHEQDQSSNKSYTDESENEIAAMDDSEEDELAGEAFYNYFHHGFDALVSVPQTRASNSRHCVTPTPADFVVTKIFLHSNVPGSYSFNRHRRSRWRIALDENGQPLPLTSEMRFAEVSDILKDVWQDSYKDGEERQRMQRGMVLNRGWGVGDSPESSIELLGGFEEGPSSTDNAATNSGIDASISNLNNTELFGFPGLLFEVLKNDTICCLTVYKIDQ